MFGAVIPPGAGQEPSKLSRPFDLLALITTIVCGVVVIIGALVYAGVIGHPTTELLVIIVAAFLGLGIAVPGLQGHAQTVANTASVAAVHKRLDALGAPPADDGGPMA